MELHRGRLIDHVHLRVKDVEASKRFYRAVMSAIGLEDAFVEGHGLFYADELFVDAADTYVTRVHVAFQVPDLETVHAFHRAESPGAVKRPLDQVARHPCRAV